MKTYLLLHLSDLKVVSAQLRVINILAVIAVPVLDDSLHLLDQSATSAGDRLASILELLLSLAHEAGLHSRRSDKLGGGSGNVVGSNDKLLGAVAAGDDTVGSLDEHICGHGDGLGGGDETFGPAVVLLVELCGAHAAAAALLHDLGLR